MKKNLGQVMTPPTLARRMTTLRRNEGNVLEPSCGEGVFLDLLPSAVGVELDATQVQERHRSRVHIGDYLAFEPTTKFKTIIGNPPYVCTKKTSHGKQVTHFSKKTVQTTLLPASANLYFNFVERALEQLDDDGELIFVVPIEFFHLTCGDRLRERMILQGAFTDVWFETKADWKASVEVVVFRYQKGTITLPVTRDGVPGYQTVLQNGKVFFVDYKPVAFVGDFFKAVVGNRPRASATSKTPMEDYTPFASVDGDVWVCDHDWPRRRKPVVGDKILFADGPTRRRPRFVSSTASEFVSCALLPKQVLNLNDWVAFLEENVDWSTTYAHLNGRWRTNPGLIAATPLRSIPVETPQTAKKEA